MANVFAVLAAHQRSLHELIDAQHQVLRQQLADAGWLRDIELDGGAQLEGISGGLAPKLGTSQQSLQPTLPDDVDPLPPNTPKSALLTASPSAFVLLTSQDSPSVNSAGSHLAQPELTSQEVVKILSKTDEEEQETSPGSQPSLSQPPASARLGSHSSAMIAQRAFSKNDKVKFIYRLDCLAGLCVLVNSIFMAIELEFEGRFNGQTLNQGHAPVADPSFFFSVSDNIFAVLYFLELMARIAVERRKFFTTLVNWFDIFLATITCFDVWVLRPMALSGGATDQMILLRLARAVKSMRAIRMVTPGPKRARRGVIRTLRLFRGLRVLVQACYSFLPSLCWSMVLLGIFMVMGALMLGNMLQEFIADQGQDFDTREWIWQHYGTALRAMYTLYEITFAGNWPTYARPVIDGVSSYFAVFFLLYITLIVFAVIRVITAIFLKDTLDAASNDAEHLVVEKLQKKAQYVRRSDEQQKCLRCDEFLRIRSVSGEGPGGSYAVAVQWLKRFCHRVGLATQQVEPVKGKPVLLATWPGRDPSLPALLLNSHYDVVPAMEEFWTVDPWAAQIKDGKIYGRGTQDMKSVCVQYLLAIERLKKKHFMPERTVHLSFVPDEEVGGVEGMGELLKTAEFQALGTLGLALDEGLANPGDAFTVFYGERTPWWILVRASGPTGHGSRFIKETAPQKLLRMAERALAFRQAQEEALGHDQNGALGEEDGGRGVAGMAKKMQGLRSGMKGGCKHGTAKKLGDVTTLNLTMLRTGVSNDNGKTFCLNVIPTEAEAGFDVRITPNLAPKDFQALLDKWCEDEGVVWQFAPWTRELHIPALGFSPMKNCPILLHEHNEYLPVDIFLAGIEVYVGLVEALASKEKLPGEDEQLKRRKLR
eukprot:g17999.t1